MTSVVLREWYRVLLLTPLLLAGCGGVAAQNAEYPDIKVRSPVLELVIKDERKEVLETITEANKVYQDEKVSFSQLLPDGFEAGASERLQKLSGDSGLPLQVVTLVQHASITFSNDHSGDLTRYDVQLAFRIQTDDGLLLQKGSGTSFQELPAEEATPSEMRRIFLVAALNAFDQYFAEEDTLERLNTNIDAYLAKHPTAAR